MEHSGINISEEVVAQAMANIYYKKINPKTEIDRGLFHEVLNIINAATATGFRQAAYNPTGEFQRQIESNNAVFSAFKVHAQQNAMAARLLDDKGNLKPFSKWKKEVTPIANHHNKVWLRTEYDTAVIRAHRTADFVRFKAQSDVLPNIKWLRTSSHTPGQDHAPFWSLPVILPVGHPFWNEHRPGDRWNCKCSWRATDEPATKDITLEVPPSSMPHRGLDNNPATDGQIFNDNHPYFPKSCATCPLNGTASKLFANLSAKQKNCYECKKAAALVKKATSPTAEQRQKFLDEMKPLLKERVTKQVGDKEITVRFTTKGNKHLYSDTFGRADFDKEKLKYLAKYLKKAEFVKVAEISKSRKDDIVRFYYFEDKKRGVFYNVAEEVSKGRTLRYLYSITKKIRS